MKIKHIITEVPLPNHFDKSKFKSNVPFAQRIRHAKEHAKQIGVGSSRVAFIIEFEGRKTVLKIAKNQKGLAQNGHEAQMLDDAYASRLGITIPMIDFDEENDMPTWIHVEFADKMKPNDFKNFFGGISHNELKGVLEYLIGRRGASESDESRYEQLQEDNENIDALVDLVGNFDIPIGDFARLANWGVYKGGPVIIDLGLNNDVLKTYYRF